MQNDFEVRAASETDIPAIARCLAEAFEPYRGAYTPAGFADTVPDAAGLGQRLKTMHILVAETGGRILGTVAGAVNGEEGHLRGMAVAPECRGSGAAARLLSAIEAWLGMQGCTRVTLDTTLPLEPAMRFYEKNGYRRSGKVGDHFGMPLIEYAKWL